MPPFKYPSINKQRHEIGLINLFPGDFADKVEIGIFHHAFLDGEDNIPSTLSIKERGFFSHLSFQDLASRQFEVIGTG